MRKSFGLILDHFKDVLIFFYCWSFLACKNFEVCLHDSKRSSQLMSSTGRKLLLCCKRIIQSGKHLIKRACKTRNLIVCIWNFKRLRKILGLYFIDFVTESSQRQQCTAADKICTDTAQENNDCSCNDTSGAEKVFGFLYLIGKTCKQSVWINVKGDWRGISFIDLYDIITQIFDSGNSGVTNKKIHQDTGDSHQERDDQCQPPLQREFFQRIFCCMFFFHFRSSMRM